MKKVFLCAACAFVVGANAYQNIGWDVYFSGNYWNKLYYKNYNNPNDMVFGGSFEYEGDTGTKKYSAELEGMVGKNLSFKSDGKLDIGVNVLGGGLYSHEKQKNIKNDTSNSFGLKAALNVSGAYDKNIIYSIDMSYATYFGDFDGHKVSYEISSGYKFTQNFYAKSNLKFVTSGKNEKNNNTSTYLGFGVGYSF